MEVIISTYTILMIFILKMADERSTRVMISSRNIFLPLLMLSFESIRSLSLSFSFIDAFSSFRSSMGLLDFFYF